MRSGLNIANIEKYIFRPIPALFDLTFAGFFPVIKPFDVCFNDDNHDIAIPSNKWRQAKCYTYLCYPNRSKVDTPNLKDSILSTSHVPNGYCATRVQRFCTLAKNYCTYNGLGCSFMIPHTNTSWSDGNGAFDLNIQDAETIAGAALALLFGLKINPLPTAFQAPCLFYDSLCCPLFFSIDRKLYPLDFNLTFVVDQIVKGTHNPPIDPIGK